MARPHSLGRYRGCCRSCSVPELSMRSPFGMKKIGALVALAAGSAACGACAGGGLPEPGEPQQDAALVQEGAPDVGPPTSRDGAVSEPDAVVVAPHPGRIIDP